MKPLPRMPRGAPFAAMLVLLWALFLRAPLTGAGMPYFYHEDEAHHFNRVVNMMKSGELNPKYFHKPSLHFYVRMPAAAAAFLWGVRKGELRTVGEIVTRDPQGVGDYAFSASDPRIVVWNRALSVLLSLAAIALCVHLTLRFTASWWAALFAGALAATSAELLRASAFIGVDILVAPLALLATALSLKLVHGAGFGAIAAASLAAGLAVSSKYNAAPIALVPLAALCAARDRRPGAYALACAGAAAGFLAGTPYLLAEVPLFLNHLAYEIWHYGVAGHEGHTGEPGVGQARFYLSWLAGDGLGTAGAVLAVAGAFLLIVRTPREGAVFALFPLLFFVLMAAQRANFERNMVPLVLYAAVFAAVAVHFVVRGARITRVVAALLAFLALATAVPRALAVRAEPSARVESRVEAERFLREKRAGFDETAVAAELQLSHTLGQREGVHRIPAAAISPELLYQGGFTRIIVPASWQPPPAEAPLLERELALPGATERRRIVENPALTVYRLRWPEGYRPAAPLEEAFTIARAPGGASEVRCERAAAAAPAEEHCWVTQQRMAIGLEGIASGEASDLALELEVMSPWPNQRFSIDGAQPGTAFIAEPGRWTKIKFRVPRARGLGISVSEVHSPEDFGLGPDRRRLGVAVRTAKIE